jgi:putative tricarboxylic transport membrane protein
MTRTDRLSAVIFFALAVFITFKAGELGIGNLSTPGPGFLLFCSSVAMGLLAVVLFVRTFFLVADGPSSTPWNVAASARPLAALAAIVLYAIFLATGGFLLTTAGFMFVAYHLGRLRPWTAIVAAVVTTILTYVVFHLFLQVPFPRGFWR